MISRKRFSSRPHLENLDCVCVSQLYSSVHSLTLYPGSCLILPQNSYIFLLLYPEMLETTKQHQYLLIFLQIVKNFIYIVPKFLFPEETHQIFAKDRCSVFSILPREPTVTVVFDKLPRLLQVLKKILLTIPFP